MVDLTASNRGRPKKNNPDINLFSNSKKKDKLVGGNNNISYYFLAGTIVFIVIIMVLLFFVALFGFDGKSGIIDIGGGGDSSGGDGNVGGTGVTLPVGTSGSSGGGDDEGSSSSGSSSGSGSGGGIVRMGFFADFFNSPVSLSPGDDIYYNDGFVGIGTDSPTQNLEVNGIVNISNIGDNAGDLYVHDDVIIAGSRNPRLIIDKPAVVNSAVTLYQMNGVVEWIIGMNAGTIDYHITNASNSKIFTIAQSGNVGIGTTTPANTLDVKGYIRGLSQDNNDLPTSGMGVEIMALNDISYLNSYDRTNEVWKELRIGGSTIKFNNVGGDILLLGLKADPNMVCDLRVDDNGRLHKGPCQGE